MLDFEKSLYEIKEKINSLKESQEKNDVDLQDEIDLLEASLERERKKYIPI
ncbi:acetyl-CoA carboxylase carboxyltransferase subunit alpha domain protein [Staphylococcus hominis VCU122]|nr:acetyl-CoA carboxylase carboxyltransferase subunit alpha domain protein [Staphylococcus hominis VCU122]